MTNPVDQIVSVFKRDKGFERLFSLFIEKYRTYERVEKGISVTLNNPTPIEKRSISGLVGRDLTRNRSITISASKFEKALANTKFGKNMPLITLQQILEIYNGEKLTSKREEHLSQLTERDSYFKEWYTYSHSEVFRELVTWIQSDAKGTNRFLQLYKQDKDSLSSLLSFLEKVCLKLPLNEYVYLPIFSADITKDPHTFDLDREEGKMLIYTLQVLKHIQNEEPFIQDPNAEKITELLYEFKILRDDLQNYVTVFNAVGYNQNGKENLLLKGGREEKSTYHLPLREVMKLETITSASNSNNLFMIENSSVSSKVINECIKADVEATILSGNGQLKLATLRFLDRFVKSGGTIYYAGDFDPEGILIADRLMKRYKGKVKLWRYGREEYLTSLSNKIIPSRRLKQLSGLKKDSLLSEIRDEMLQVKKSGYQENIITKLTSDLCNGKYAGDISSAS